MQITVLTDNNVLNNKPCFGEAGLSFFIELDDKKLLFDFAYSDIFLKNAITLGIDLKQLDYAVVSHGHLDHMWGIGHYLQYLTNKKLLGDKINNPIFIAHPDVFISKKFDKINLNEIGSLISKEKLNLHFEYNLTKEPFWITDKLVFLGEIEKKYSFEGKIPIGKKFIDGQMVDDYMPDDSALAYKSSNGVIVITGCSHSGICNIIDYAKKVCNDNRVNDVIGGFHLQNPKDELLEGTLEYFKNSNIPVIHPCHCTDLKSKIKLSEIINVEEVGSGFKMIVE
ncbi:MAG: MBL fold metallo-hydrolase [Pseudomonadota bacterium]